MVQRVLKGVLFPSHWIRYWRDVERKLGIYPGGEQIEMGTPEDLADRLKYPWQEGPFCQKDLVGTTELVRQNILLLWNITSRQGDRMTPRPKNNVRRHAAQHLRDCADLIPQISYNCGIVAHQNDTLTEQLRQKSRLGQSNSFHLQRTAFAHSGNRMNEL